MILSQHSNQLLYDITYTVGSSAQYVTMLTITSCTTGAFVGFSGIEEIKVLGAYIFVFALHCPLVIRVLPNTRDIDRDYVTEKMFNGKRKYCHVFYAPYRTCYFGVIMLISLH